MTIKTTTHIPHPAAKHRVYASLVHVLKDWVAEEGEHRVVFKFLTSNPNRPDVRRPRGGRTSWGFTPPGMRGGPTEAPDAKKVMFDRDSKIALYMSQSGRSSALWMDDQFWRISVRRWTKKSQDGMTRMKVEIVPVELSKSHEKSLKKAVSKYL